eukprot:3456548-Rhodomonas_salina.1
MAVPEWTVHDVMRMLEGLRGRLGEAVGGYKREVIEDSRAGASQEQRLARKEDSIEAGTVAGAVVEASNIRR